MILQQLTQTLFETTSTVNPILDENGQFVTPEEAVRNFSTLWKEWDLVNKFFDKLPTIIIAVIIVIIGFWLSKLIPKIVVKGMKAKGVDSSVYIFIKNIISALIKITFLLSAFSMFFNINSFLAAIGAAGITAGIGLQDCVAQFASGIQILMTHPFKAGDYIEVAGQSGNVAEIRFMNTVITTIDNKRIVVPNSHITKNQIVNYSAEENRRVDLTYSIGYSDDIQKAKSVILEVAESNQAILTDPMPVVYVNSHGSSSIELITKLWCKCADYWDVYYAMQEEVKLAFDRNGINIPYNQVDVHIMK